MRLRDGPLEKNSVVCMTLLLLATFPQVQQPVSPLVAAPGSDITLGCSFPHSDTDNVLNVIVNWQRGTTEVVHSYYHGKDQLDRQSPAYRGRTQLSPDELKEGNASLSLMGVQASDHGEYTCAVSNEQGSFQEHILLQVAAPYDEPHLDVQVTCDSIILTLTSSEGFPRPTLMWRDMTGSDITNQSTTTLDLNSRGRYDVRSKMEFKSRNTQRVTIEMSLGVLKQGFSRVITLQPLSEHCVKPEEHRNRYTVIISIVVVSFGMCCLLIFLYKKQRSGQQAVGEESRTHRPMAHELTEGPEEL